MTSYAGRRALVTGGAGAIGSYLARKLSEAGASVVVVDDFSVGTPSNLPQHACVRLVSGNILSPPVLAEAFASRPEVVFHLAAFFANQNSVDHPEDDLYVNTLGTLRVLEAARHAGCSRFVYPSTSAVYDCNARLPIVESAITISLTTPYQISKLSGEMYCLYFQRQYGLEVVIARLFSSYGPGEAPGKYRNVIPNFIWKAMNGEALTITGSGEETRDFTYVGDVAEGLLRCGSIPEAAGKTLNIASGRGVQIRWLAEAINHRIGNRAGIVMLPRRDWDAKLHTLASIEAARSILGYEPRVQIEEGLERTVSWITENRQWIGRQVAASYAGLPR